MPPIRRSTYLLAALALIALVGSLLWKPAPPPAFVGIRGEDVPQTIGAWKSQGDSPITPEVRAALSTADIVARTYRSIDASGLPTLDFVVIGGDGSQRPARSTLVSSGSRLAAGE